jgi:hypothetical protein
MFLTRLELCRRGKNIFFKFTIGLNHFIVVKQLAQNQSVLARDISGLYNKSWTIIIYNRNDCTIIGPVL